MTREEFRADIGPYILAGNSWFVHEKINEHVASEIAKRDESIEKLVASNLDTFRKYQDEQGKVFVLEAEVKRLREGIALNKGKLGMLSMKTATYEQIKEMYRDMERLLKSPADGGGKETTNEHYNKAYPTPLPKMEWEKEQPTCSSCGESTNLHYNDLYANGESWKCNECGHEFMHQPQSGEGKGHE